MRSWDDYIGLDLTGHLLLDFSSVAPMVSNDELRRLAAGKQLALLLTADQVDSWSDPLEEYSTVFLAQKDVGQVQAKLPDAVPLLRVSDYDHHGALKAEIRELTANTGASSLALYGFSDLLKLEAKKIGQ